MRAGRLSPRASPRSDTSSLLVNRIDISYSSHVTHYTQADVDLADQHIAAGETHIVGQETLLTELEVNGQATEAAEELLRQLHASLVEHRKHRAAIVAALEDARQPQ